MSCRRSRSARGHGAGARAALALAERVGGELGLPVFVYGELGAGRGPAFFRAAGLEGLRRRVESASSRRSSGRRARGSAGGVLVGARRPLIAFNVNLRGSSSAAREIAAVVRERDGGFPGVRALGLELPRAGLVQVSMNVEDWEAAALHDGRGRIEARRRRAGRRWSGPSSSA